MIFSILIIKFKDSIVMIVFVLSKLIFIFLIISYSNQLLFFEPDQIPKEDLEKSIKNYSTKIDSYQSTNGTFKSMICRKNGNCQFVNVEELDYLNYLEIKNIKMEEYGFLSIKKKLEESLAIDSKNPINKKLFKSLSENIIITNNENSCDELLDKKNIVEQLDTIYFNLKLNKNETCLKGNNSEIFKNLNLINPKQLDFKDKILYFNILIELEKLEDSNYKYYLNQLIFEIINKDNNNDYSFMIEIYEKNNSYYYSREYLFIQILKLLTFYHTTNYN